MIDAERRSAQSTGVQPRVSFGVGVSGGVARGRARLVASREDLANVQSDNVLVVVALPAGWLPDWAGCRAVVTRTGGLLPLSARWLREHGIPAVVGVRDAWDHIRDGDEVEVDGFLGIVRIVSPGHAAQPGRSRPGSNGFQAAS